MEHLTYPVAMSIYELSSGRSDSRLVKCNCEAVCVHICHRLIAGTNTTRLVVITDIQLFCMGVDGFG